MNNMHQTIIFIIASVAGAITTFLLQRIGFSSVVASCLVGLLGSVVGHYMKLPHLPLVVFAGSFVGMTSGSIGTIPLIFLSSVLTGFLYSVSLNIFVGFGGRLGTIAFISTIISVFVLFSIKKIKPILKK